MKNFRIVLNLKALLLTMVLLVMGVNAFAAPNYCLENFRKRKPYSNRYKKSLVNQGQFGLTSVSYGMRVTGKISQEELIGRAKIEAKVRSVTSPLWDIRSAIVRSPDINKLKDLILNSPEKLSVYYEVLRPMTQSMDSLYNKYSEQGPERTELLADILKQDKGKEQRRVTHIMTLRWFQLLAHVQLLVSNIPSEKLHIEKQWGPLVKDFVKRTKKYEKFGELGRLFSASPNQKSNETYGLLPEIENVTQKERDHYLFTSLSTAISWGLEGAKLDKLFMQVNEAVEKVLIRKGLPLGLAKRLVVSKKWEGNQKEVREVILSFDKKAMRKVNAFLMGKLFIRWSEDFLNDSFYQGAGVNEAYFSFRSIDIPALIDSGIITVDKETVNTNGINREKLTHLRNRAGKLTLTYSRKSLEVALEKAKADLEALSMK